MPMPGATEIIVALKLSRQCTPDAYRAMRILVSRGCGPRPAFMRPSGPFFDAKSHQKHEIDVATMTGFGAPPVPARMGHEIPPRVIR